MGFFFEVAFTVLEVLFSKLLIRAANIKLPKIYTSSKYSSQVNSGPIQDIFSLVLTHDLSAAKIWGKRLWGTPRWIEKAKKLQN